MKTKYFLYSLALSFTLIEISAAQSDKDSGWATYLINTEEPPILSPIEHPYLQPYDPHAPSAVVIDGYVIPLESETDLFAPFAPAPSTPPEVPFRPPSQSNSHALSTFGRKIFLPGNETEQNHGTQFFVLPAAPIGGKYVITFEQNNPVVEFTQNIPTKPSLLNRIWSSVRGRRH